MKQNMDDDERRRSLDTNVQLILGFMKDKIEDLKEHVTTEIKRLEDKIDNKCVSCVFVESLRLKSDENWFHVKTLWSMIAVLWAGIATVFFYLYEHVGSLK